VESGDGILLRHLAASGSQVVCKNSGRPDEDIILDDQAVPEVNPALEGDPVADPHVSFDEGMITDVAVLTDYGTTGNMSKSPNSGARTYRHILVDQGM
jgi:hypothetical protein